MTPTRRKSIPVMVGKVQVGGDAPVVVQSMTNTDTEDAKSTAEQIAALARAGSEIVRITVNTEAAAQQVPEIKRRLQDMGCDVPLVGDFHYNGHLLLTQYPDCARTLDKYRINPGNVGFGKKKDAQFSAMIQVAIDNDKPVRIGVNWGSLDQALLAHLMDENARRETPHTPDAVMRETLIQSALQSAEMAETLGLARNKILLACKVSRVQELVALYRDLARRCDYALHLGLTEAGMDAKGIVATTAALSILLQEGIGDTIRASLTPTPGGDRTEEVRVCKAILQSMEIRAFTPQVSACPGCGRTTSTVFQSLAQSIQTYIENEMPLWKTRYPGVETLKCAVMGCVVNGPGESKHADIGISLPGTGEAPVAPVFIEGKKTHTLRGETIAEDFQKILLTYIEARFGSAPVTQAQTQ